MRNKAGMKFDCIFEETLDFIDIDYTHLNKTIRYEQRPHGEWIEHEDKDYKGRGYNMCSVCNWKFSFGAYPLIYEQNFCPHCGADMREGEAREE